MTIFIPGPPVGKQSVRTARGHAYIPAKSRSYMSVVTALYQVLHAPLIRGAFQMTISEYRPRPQYHYRTGRNAGIIKDQYREAPCITRPDLSNVQKGIEDALNGVAYTDDSANVHHIHTKRYANPGEKVGVFVTIEPAVNEPEHTLRPEHRQATD